MLNKISRQIAAFMFGACAFASAAPVDLGAAQGGCGTLIGRGMHLSGDQVGTFRSGAFRLADGESISFFRTDGQRTFGRLEIGRYRNGYEAFWRPMGSTKRYLLIFNGLTQASLFRENGMHWTIPEPLGTIVGPLSISSCDQAK